MGLHHRSELSLEAPASPAEWHWPAWCLRLAVRWTTRCIEQVQGQLADDFATDAMAPLYRELEVLHLEREALLRRLGRRAAA